MRFITLTAAAIALQGCGDTKRSVKNEPSDEIVKIALNSKRAQFSFGDSVITIPGIPKGIKIASVAASVQAAEFPHALRDIGSWREMAGHVEELEGPHCKDTAFTENFVNGEVARFHQTVDGELTAKFSTVSQTTSAYDPREVFSVRTAPKIVDGKHICINEWDFEHLKEVRRILISYYDRFRAGLPPAQTN